MAQVAIVRCPDYQRETLRQAIRRIEELLGGWDQLVGNRRRVLIKPNLLAGEEPDRAVTTHPEVLRAVVERLLELGVELEVGDSPGMGSLAAVAEKAGVARVCRELAVPLARFQESVPVEVAKAKLIKKFELAREVKAADFLVNIAKMKTHGLTILTGAVKNLFGCVVGIRKAEFHLRLQKVEHFAEMLLDLTRAVPPALHIVDAVVAMEGWGPRNGKPRRVGLLVAGTDPVAVDVTLALLMNVPPHRISYLGAAAARGWEGADPEKLRILGEDLQQLVMEDYEIPRELYSLSLRIPKPVVRLFRRSITPRPHVLPDCKGCGICAKACPARVIRIESGKAFIREKDCIRCYCCQEMCPYGAIQLRTGVLGRLYRRKGKH
ncbi:MAG TPA: DUF362 domain-containing protein [Firmicutes bacterium]|nr:DUF362 domain-containing protein [Bacillota bacterium]HOQ24134.1 DUF362 domain-containing protein [Bacillota bacterium]HPT66439.1 DUF362 domain-containing protein [Bacillota bacterium]